LEKSFVKYSVVSLGVIMLVLNIAISIQTEFGRAFIIYSLFSAFVIIYGFLKSKIKIELLSTLITTFVLVFSLLALLPLSFIAFSPIIYRGNETTELTPRMIEKLENSYGMRLPESTEFIKGVSMPAFQDPTTQLWFNVAEEDFESIFIGDIWIDSETGRGTCISFSLKECIV